MKQVGAGPKGWTLGTGPKGAMCQISLQPSAYSPGRGKPSRPHRASLAGPPAEERPPTPRVPSGGSPARTGGPASWIGQLGPTQATPATRSQARMGSRAPWSPGRVARTPCRAGSVGVARGIWACRGLGWEWLGPSRGVQDRADMCQSCQGNIGYVFARSNTACELACEDFVSDFLVQVRDAPHSTHF